jgi:hypothetical protein
MNDPCCCAAAILILQALLKWIHSYKHSEDHMVYISSSIYWTAAYVLAHLETTEGRT